MVDGVGVCTICARVCHAGHDVTYSKHGSFFCDCGAKEDGSCIALVKRTASLLEERRSASFNTTSYENSLRRRTSSPPATSTTAASTKVSEKESTNKESVTDEAVVKRRQKLSKKLFGWQEVLSDGVSMLFHFFFLRCRRLRKGSLIFVSKAGAYTSGVSYGAPLWVG